MFFSAVHTPVLLTLAQEGSEAGGSFRSWAMFAMWVLVLIVAMVAFVMLARILRPDRHGGGLRTGRAASAVDPWRESARRVRVEDDDDEQEASSR